MREGSSHFVQQRNGRKAKILLLRDQVKRRIYYWRLYIYSKGMFIKLQVIKIASASTENPVTWKHLPHIHFLSSGNK